MTEKSTPLQTVLKYMDFESGGKSCSVGIAGTRLRREADSARHVGSHIPKFDKCMPQDERHSIGSTDMEMPDILVLDRKSVV